MRILNFWLDFDGCAYGAIKLREKTPGSRQWQYYADINHPLLVDMILVINAELLKGGEIKVFISSGSNRQTFEADALNGRKGVISEGIHLITCSSIQGLTAIYPRFGS